MSRSLGGAVALALLASCASLFAACSAPAPAATPDAFAFDAGPYDAGPCLTDLDCPATYCNPGSHICCVPAVPAYEICGDRIDQNCDERDESCGDNDDDGVQACMPGQDPLGGCDCDDESAEVRPVVSGVAGAPEICDMIDNDCNGRVDESAACCSGCDSLGADRALRADVCTADGECDCAGEDGIGPCAVGLRCCVSGCVDLATDIDNCGVCRAACNQSADRCVAGACMCGTGSACALINLCTDGVCAE